MNNSKFEIICGCMFSGKTEELIKRIKILENREKKVLVLKHAFDIRYSKHQLCSHSGIKINANLISHLEQIDQFDIENFHAIAIDEIQFFNESAIVIIEKLLNLGKHIVVSGLAQDYKREPFGIMPLLLSKAEYITKLSANCTVCGLDAHYTQRLSNNSDVVLIGGKEIYEPRCRVHHKY